MSEARRKQCVEYQVWYFKGTGKFAYQGGFILPDVEVIEHGCGQRSVDMQPGFGHFRWLIDNEALPLPGLSGRWDGYAVVFHKDGFPRHFVCRR